MRRSNISLAGGKTISINRRMPARPPSFLGQVLPPFLPSFHSFGQNLLLLPPPLPPPFPNPLSSSSLLLVSVLVPPAKGISFIFFFQGKTMNIQRRFFPHTPTLSLSNTLHHSCSCCCCCCCHSCHSCCCSCCCYCCCCFYSLSLSLLG